MLPVEVILVIYYSFDDLDSLLAFVQASTYLYSIFENYQCSIIEYYLGYDFNLELYDNMNPELTFWQRASMLYKIDKLEPIQVNNNTVKRGVVDEIPESFGNQVELLTDTKIFQNTTSFRDRYQIGKERISICSMDQRPKRIYMDLGFDVKNKRVNLACVESIEYYVDYYKIVAGEEIDNLHAPMYRIEMNGKSEDNYIVIHYDEQQQQHGLNLPLVYTLRNNKQGILQTFEMSNCNIKGIATCDEFMFCRRMGSRYIEIYRISDCELIRFIYAFEGHDMINTDNIQLCATSSHLFCLNGNNLELASVSIQKLLQHDNNNEKLIQWQPKLKFKKAKFLDLHNKHFYGRFISFSLKMFNQNRIYYAVYDWINHKLRLHTARIHHKTRKRFKLMFDENLNVIIWSQGYISELVEKALIKQQYNFTSIENLKSNKKIWNNHFKWTKQTLLIHWEKWIYDSSTLQYKYMYTVWGLNGDDFGNDEEIKINREIWNAFIFHTIEVKDYLWIYNVGQKMSDLSWPMGKLAWKYVLTGDPLLLEFL